MYEAKPSIQYTTCLHAMCCGGPTEQGMKALNNLTYLEAVFGAEVLEIRQHFGADAETDLI